MKESKTYVLLHGAWHGGWCWRFVAEALRDAGHVVFTPTQTGLGERRHLLSHDITLETFVADLANVFEAEELDDVILVGHSFGGLAISGVADRMPERIRHLVYLDSMILEGGQSPFGILPAEVVAARRKIAEERGNGISVPAPELPEMGIPEDHPLGDWVLRQMTSHPISTYESVLKLANAVGNGLPRTYLQCTNPFYPPLAPVREWLSGQEGWLRKDIATGHDCMVTAPTELAAMLMQFE
jgi:pimeloyl-ACP methyl ester carboxylesterase